MNIEEHFKSVVTPAYQNVDGWLPPNQAVALFAIANSLPPASTIVEIGSWQGKSAIVLAYGVKDNPGSEVFCIDPFNYAGGPQYVEKDHDLFDGFKANIEAAGIAHIVEPVKGYSADVARVWTQAIDLLFIDGDHHYEHVIADLRAWAPFVRRGGVIAMHDVYPPGTEAMGGYEPGPWKAAAEFFQTGTWSTATLIESLMFVRKL